MDDYVFTYIIDLPDNVNEMVTPCADGYTVYLNAKLSYRGRVRAYEHALQHISHNDFEKYDVQLIEAEAHKKGDYNGTF